MYWKLGSYRHVSGVSSTVDVVDRGIEKALDSNEGVYFEKDGNKVWYEPERTCHMTLKKSGPLYDVWHFDCCEEEWSESRCDNGVVDYPGLFCPWCSARVVE